MGVLVVRPRGGRHFRTPPHSGLWRWADGQNVIQALGPGKAEVLGMLDIAGLTLVLTLAKPHTQICFASKL